MRSRLARVGVVCASVLALSACGRAASPQATSATVAVPTTTVQVTPQANTVASAGAVDPDPRVGAVFLGGDSWHTCSAAVLDTPGGDLILTAAHCLTDGVDTTFVPGFHDDADNPWHVRTVYLDPRWLTDQDPQADFAIARVSRDDGVTVQSDAGGGLLLGAAPPAGTAVTVTGYPMGEGGGPLGCRGVTGTEQGFPSLPCAGLTNGFSGAPWTVGSTVTGLVGGLDGGGCDDDVSFSPRFDTAIAAVLARAEAGGDGDAAPAAFGDDC